VQKLCANSCRAQLPGDIPNALVFNESKGTRFSTQVKIKNMDGTLTATDQSVGLSGGTEALVFVSVATSFNGFDKIRLLKVKMQSC